MTAVLVRPFVGAMADQQGKKGLMVGGAVVMVVSAALYVAAQSILLLFLLRILHGAGWGVFSTACSALVADVIPPRRRGEGMGYYGIFGNVAMATGPALGVLVADSAGFSLLFWISAGVAAMGLASVVGVKEAPAIPLAPVAPFRARLFHRRALYPSAILLCVALSYGSIVSFLPLFAAKQQLGNPGLFFTVFAVVLIVARGPIGRLSDKYGRLSVVAPSLAIGAASLAILAMATSMGALLVVAVLYGLSFAAALPSLMAFVVDRVGPAESGSGMGTFTTAMDLGIGAGTVVWGVVAQLSGYEALFLSSAFTTLLGLAVILAGNLRRL